MTVRTYTQDPPAKHVHLYCIHEAVKAIAALRLGLKLDSVQVGGGDGGTTYSIPELTRQSANRALFVVAAGSQAIDPPGMEREDDFANFAATKPLSDRDADTLAALMPKLKFGENEDGRKWRSLFYFALKPHMEEESVRHAASVLAAALENRYVPIMGARMTGQEVLDLVGDVPLTDVPDLI